MGPPARRATGKEIRRFLLPLSHDPRPLFGCRSNSFVTGQVLCCALRFEVYYSETVRRAAELGRTLPPNYRLNLIAGLDVAAPREDGSQALLAQSSPESLIEEAITTISEIAVAEHDGATAGAPGYHEAWAQAAACSTMFGQFGLFEAYR